MTVVLALVLALLAGVAPQAGAAPLRFGIQIAPENATYDEIARTAVLVEELGYDGLWLNDHLVPVMGDRDLPHFEAWTMLAALATQTKRIRIGVLVSGNTYRHPAVLAKEATTVDHVSHGRLDFGLGAGWEEFEHRAYGIPFYTAEERAARLGEVLEVITRLWRDDHPTYSGKYYRLEKAPFAPKPVQRPHPPIVIGGQGKKWITLNHDLMRRFATEIAPAFRAPAAPE